jgi:hypothetical protein
MGLRIALVALLIAIAGCTSGPHTSQSPGAPVTAPAAAAGSPSPTPEPSSWPTVPPELPRPTMPAGVDGELADMIHTRQTFGIRSDVEWVKAVAADPAAESMLEIPMLPEESRVWLEWSNQTDRLVEALGTYGRLRPDEFGGIYIDQLRREVVTLWTDHLEEHQARIRELTWAGAPTALYRVEHPESYLRSLQDLVPTDDPVYVEAQAEPYGIGVDIKRNAVSIDVSSANPDAPRLVAEGIAARLGVPANLVTVDSDGTGVLLLPFGQIQIRLIGSDGGRIAKPWSLDWRFDGPQLGGCGPGGDMWVGFNERGVLRTACNPGTWMIDVLDDKDRVVGRGEAVIRADELTKVTITLDERVKTKQ